MLPRVMHKLIWLVLASCCAIPVHADELPRIPPGAKPYVASLANGTGNLYAPGVATKILHITSAYLAGTQAAGGAACEVAINTSFVRYDGTAKKLLDITLSAVVAAVSPEAGTQAIHFGDVAVGARCNTTVGRTCRVDGDCPSGETCTVPTVTLSSTCGTVAGGIQGWEEPATL